MISLVVLNVIPKVSGRHCAPQSYRVLDSKSRLGRFPSLEREFGGFHSDRKVGVTIWIGLLSRETKATGTMIIAIAGLF